MADEPNYLELARELQGRLRDRTASESDTKWRELLVMAAAEFHDQKDKFVHSRNRSQTPRRAEDERIVGGEEQVCLHVCCEHEEVMKPDRWGAHEEVMKPDRWGALPDELLQLMFARLPVKKILHLECLSKDWKESLGARGDSVFLRACDEAHPKMFALVSNTKERNLFQVRVFDIKFNAWHAFQIPVAVPKRDWPKRHRSIQWRNMSSEDGGLVLFDMEAHPKPWRKGFCPSYFLKVMNPLTGYEYDLPPIEDVQHVLMKRIIVDPETNRYQVLIVVKRRLTAAANHIQVFHPETRRWSQPSEARNVMFGNQSAYDFATGRLGRGHGNIPSLCHEWNVLDHTFLKNRLFVLFKDTDAPSNVLPTNRLRETHVIKEYVVEYHPQHLPTWSEVDVHNCGPFESTPRRKYIHSYKFIMFSSNGFLVVFETLTELTPWHNDKGWLYDLSTRTWRDLPKLPGDEYVWLQDNRICEIRWNAHPSY